MGAFIPGESWETMVSWARGLRCTSGLLDLNVGLVWFGWLVNQPPYDSLLEHFCWMNIRSLIILVFAMVSWFWRRRPSWLRRERPLIHWLVVSSLSLLKLPWRGWVTITMFSHTQIILIWFCRHPIISYLIRSDIIPDDIWCHIRCHIPVSYPIVQHFESLQFHHFFMSWFIVDLIQSMFKDWADSLYSLVLAPLFLLPPELWKVPRSLLHRTRVGDCHSEILQDDLEMLRVTHHQIRSTYLGGVGGFHKW